jgi:hypothetical protein
MTMNTEMQELTADELERVSGGSLARDIVLSVGGAILSELPIVGTFYGVGNTIGNAVTGQHQPLF